MSGDRQQLSDSGDVTAGSFAPSAAAKESLGSRSLFVLLAASATLLVDYSYSASLQPLYGYMEYNYVAPPLVVRALGYALAILPSIWLQLTLRSPSQLTIMLLYFSAYIPSMVLPFCAGLEPAASLIPVALCMCAGLFVIHRMCSGPRRDLAVPRIRSRTFWTLFFVLYGLCWAYILSEFAGRLRFVAFSQVYASGVRLDSREIFEASYVGFAVMAMYACLNPFLIAWGLSTKRLPVVALGVIGQFLCYGTGGLKIIIMSVGLSGYIFLVVGAKARRFANALAGLFTGGLLAYVICSNLWQRNNLIVQSLEMMVMRTFTIPGLLTAEYHDFFQRHPYLFLSNIRGFNLVFRYPLDMDLIHAVAYYYQGNEQATSNAHFWMQDGIANFGTVGVLVFSYLVGWVLRLADRAGKPHPVLFSTLALVFAGLNLTNTAVSTTVLSGGLGLSILLLALAPISKPGDGVSSQGVQS